ncbi:major facilitator superfamily domain-containing protein [Circinella umbellata]|nr:major facilitator superfamily domain-containing protein [Circinella umbellata]
MKNRNYNSIAPSNNSSLSKMKNSNGGIVADPCYESEKNYATDGSMSQYFKKKNDLVVECAEEEAAHSGQRVTNSLEENFPHEMPPMDGSRAWIVLGGLVVVNVFICLQTAWGVMQNYYLEHGTVLSPTSNNNLLMHLTIIGALFQVIGSGGVFIGNLVYSAAGYRLSITLAAFSSISGLILSSFVTSVWPLYLTFAVMCALGTAIMFASAYRIVTQYFLKFRGTAMGIIISNKPICGLILPLIVNQINTDLGHKWTYRILALMIFTVTIIGFAIIRERNPASKATGKIKKKKTIRESMDFRLLKNINFVIWLIITPIGIYVMYILNTFIPSYATSIGLSGQTGALGVTILSGSSIIGCVVNGYLGDKFGDINMFIIYSVIAALTVFLLWLFAHTQAILMAFCAIHGFVYLGYMASSPSIMIRIVGIDDFPSALSFRSLAVCFSILGPFLGTYLDSLNSNMEPYFYIRVLAGAGYALCALLALVIKFRMNSTLFAKI